MKRHSTIFAVLLAAAMAAVSTAALTACGSAEEPVQLLEESSEERYPEETVLSTTVYRADPSKIRAFATVYAAVPESLTSIPLYSDPDTESDTVTYLLPNDSLSVLEKQEGWLHVRFRQHTGWLMASSVSSFPATDEPEETEPVQTDYYVILPEENSIAVIYKKADPTSEQLMEPAQGTVIRLVEPEPKDGWYHVTCGEITGYLRAEYVSDEMPPAVSTTTTTTTTTTEAVTTAPPETAPAPAGTTANNAVTAPATAPPAVTQTAAPPPPAQTTAVQDPSPLVITESELWAYAKRTKAANMQMHISELRCINGNAIASYYDRSRGHCDSVTGIYITNIDRSLGSVSVGGTIEIVELRTSPGQSEPEPVVIDQIPLSIIRNV